MAEDGVPPAGGGTATIYPELDERLIALIKSQPMFFVATAPCLDEAGIGGHVNVSPKG